MNEGEIRWPDVHRPDASAVHVVNQLSMDVSAEAVWERLVHAPNWPDWYPNSSDVRLLEGETLQLGTRFRWKTFGMTIDCKVEECVPTERLAWSSRSRGMSVYHAWLITPEPQGCHVLTEETQNGLIPRIAKLLMPGRMHKYHQIWLQQLSQVARAST